MKNRFSKKKAPASLPPADMGKRQRRPKEVPPGGRAKDTRARPVIPPATAAPARRSGRPSPQTGKKRGKKLPPSRKHFFYIVPESLGLACLALGAIILILGHCAQLFAGTRFLTSLFPFALAVLGLILGLGLALAGWLRLRRFLLARALFLPAALALMLLVSALALTFSTFQDAALSAYGQFRTLIGGREEAARSFALDPDLLFGIAASESSFLPRPSKDGGQGLFQITRVPDEALLQATRALGQGQARVADQRHNAFIAAATLRHYLSQMRNDLFLGLLAYNIGPANGGLRFIMQRYGVRDFIAVQPYLQQAPREYPIRTLSYALAFRLWRKQGSLPAYEEGLNAVRIQHTGIPGLR